MICASPKGHDYITTSKGRIKNIKNTIMQPLTFTTPTLTRSSSSTFKMMNFLSERQRQTINVEMKIYSTETETETETETDNKIRQKNISN